MVLFEHKHAKRKPTTTTNPSLCCAKLKQKRSGFRFFSHVFFRSAGLFARADTAKHTSTVARKAAGIATTAPVVAFDRRRQSADSLSQKRKRRSFSPLRWTSSHSSPNSLMRWSFRLHQHHQPVQAIVCVLRLLLTPTAAARTTMRPSHRRPHCLQPRPRHRLLLQCRRHRLLRRHRSVTDGKIVDAIVRMQLRVLFAKTSQLLHLLLQARRVV